MTTLEPDQKIEYELEDGKDGKVSAETKSYLKF